MQAENDIVNKCKGAARLFPIPWFVAVLVGIPQAYFIIILGFSLFNLRIKPEHAFTVACLTSAICYLVRLSNKVIGLHTLILILTLIVLCIIITRLNAYKVSTAVLAGVTTVGAIEYSYIPLVFSITPMKLDDFILHPWWIVLIFIPEILILLIIYYLVKKHHLYILDGSLKDS